MRSLDFRKFKVGAVVDCKIGHNFWQLLLCRGEVYFFTPRFQAGLVTGSIWQKWLQASPKIDPQEALHTFFLGTLQLVEGKLTSREAPFILTVPAKDVKDQLTPIDLTADSAPISEWWMPSTSIKSSSDQKNPLVQPSPNSQNVQVDRNN